MTEKHSETSRMFYAKLTQWQDSLITLDAWLRC